MMDNLVTFAAIAGPLAVFMIVVSGVEMYIERRKKEWIYRRSQQRNSLPNLNPEARSKK